MKEVSASYKNCDKKELNFFKSPWLCGLSMAGIFSWILSVPLYGPLTLMQFPILGQSLGHVFAAAHGISLIALGWSQAAPDKSTFSQIKAMGAVLVGLTAVSGLLPETSWVLYSLFTVLGYVSAYLVLAWTPWFLAQARPAICMAIVIVGANLVLFLTGSFVPAEGLLKQVAVVFAGGASLLGAFTTQKALIKVGCLTTKPIGNSCGFLRGTIVALAAFALAAYVGGGIMYRALFPAVQEAWPSGINVSLFFYCATAVVFAPIVQRYGPHLLAGFSLCTLGLGLLLATLGYSFPDFIPISYLLIMSGEGGADMFFWLSLWSLSFYVGVYRSFGLGLGGSLLIIAATGVAVESGLLGNPAKTPITGLFGTALLFLTIPFIFQYSLPLLKFPQGSMAERKLATKPAATKLTSAGAKGQTAGSGCSETANSVLSPLSALTPAEQRVFNLLINGSSDLEMSESLFVSRHTVKFHVRNILRKAGVKNRTELLAQIISTETSIATVEVASTEEEKNDMC